MLDPCFSSVERIPTVHFRAPYVPEMRRSWVLDEVPVSLDPIGSYWISLDLMMEPGARLRFIGIPVGDVCNLNRHRQRLYEAANVLGLCSTNI